MQAKKKRSFIDNHPILAFILGVIVLGFLGKCCSSYPDLSGSLFPMDNQASDDLFIQEEYLEGRTELEQLKSDPCLYDIYMGVPPEYQRCGVDHTNSSTMKDEYYEPEQPYSSSCSCSSNRYNCLDFGTQSEAQACYEKCLLITGGDIHWLDDDGDGRACELNP